MPAVLRRQKAQKRKVRPTPRPKPNLVLVPKPSGQILLKSDKVTMVAQADKDGKVRLTCASWEDARVLLPGEILEISWVAGQVHLVKRDLKVVPK